MAIDFMVMPLSRYVIGDFITPTMRHAWEQGVPYRIIGPEGPTEYPPDTPFGGPDAPAQRQHALPMVIDDLRKALPSEAAALLWDEGSDGTPCFHRVDPGAYEALLQHASQAAPRASFLGLFKKAPPLPNHLHAGLLLPCELAAPFDMAEPLSVLAGSSPRALEQLRRVEWPAEAQPAAQTMVEAIADSLRLQLPLIVDL
jgi:hypothetical protein